MSSSVGEGFPSEHYYFGIRMWELLYGIILSFPIVAFVFVPVYYDLRVTSVYQYLELRFRSRVARRIASGTYALRTIIMLGVTMLTPSVALSGLAGLPLWVSILIIGSLTIAGSVTGGLRGVVIVDALQGVLLFFVCFFLAVLGFYHAGGFLKTFQINRERGRLDLFDFDFDPTLRISTVSALIGQLGMSVAGLGCQQNFVQRYCSMPTKKSVVV
ncbi:hypothetical protein J437_LFUL003405 [Ladona fulva]|uniref:Uncharacterized protein n=1 Tax=Ladona fulva TaxID=123851 RepID=A0A8K0K2N4_LADFU|nr:hypothetical protein J437_LFUL003405 [Ladona fulva]